MGESPIGVGVYFYLVNVESALGFDATPFQLVEAELPRCGSPERSIFAKPARLREATPTTNSKAQLSASRKVLISLRDLMSEFRKNLEIQQPLLNFFSPC